MQLGDRGRETVLLWTAHLKSFSFWMKTLSLSSQEVRRAVPFSSILLLRSRYPSSITRLKGGLL